MGDLQSYELVFELLDDLVFVSNEENDIIYANKSAKMIYGNFLAHLSPKQYTAELPDEVGTTLKKFKEDFISGSVNGFGFKSQGYFFTISGMPLHIAEGACFVFVLKNMSKHEQVMVELFESENLFRTLFENVPGGILMMSVDTKIMAANKYLCELLGYDIEDLINIPYLDLVATPDDLEFEKKIHSLIKGEYSFFEIEKQLIHKNAQHISVLSTVSVVKDNEGIPLYIIEQLTDITKRKIVEHALRVSERKFNSFFNSSSVMYLIISKDLYRIIDCNTTYSQITGFHIDQIIDNSIFSVFSEDDRSVLEKKLKSMSGNEDCSEIEVNLYANNHNRIPVTVSISKIINKKNICTSYIIACTNISHQLKIREELIHAKEKAEQSDKLKSSFLSNLSHEIRTPMNGIVGFSELLSLENQLSEKGQKYLSLVKECSHNLLQIIENIIDISKIESGTITVNNDVVSLKKVMLDIEESALKKLHTFKKKDIYFEIDKALMNKDIVIESDYMRLFQIMNILLDNAIKFTDAGNIKIGGNVTQQSELVLWISDTGIGIPNEKHDLIFERFRQADERFARRYEGNGLGLAIAKGIVNFMNGEIWLTSEENKGSVFYVKIPVIIKSIEEIPELETFSNIHNGLEQKTILLVEDDIVSAELMIDVLEDSGVKILHAKDGRSAIKMFDDNESISLVLMDIRLPDISGIEVTRYIKSRKNVPIIAQTAFTMDDEKSDFIEQGCDDYLSKPVDGDLLMAKMNAFLQNQG